jgi:uncharacterized membrane protein YcaP (DUF421 family)
MTSILDVDWHSIFVPTLGTAQVFMRGTIMYLALFAILRFMARRQAGSFGPADLLVIVLIADAAQNGLGKDYASVTEGITLVATIVAWDYFIDWLAWRFPVLRPVLKSPSLVVIRDGKIDERSLRREMLTREDLMGQLREQEVETIAEVRLAQIEGDGRLSVLRRKGN